MRLSLLVAAAFAAAVPSSAQEAAPPSVYIVVEYECTNNGRARAMELVRQAEPLFQAAADANGPSGYGVMERAYGGGSELLLYYVAPSLTGAQALYQDSGRRIQQEMPDEVAEFFELCPEQTERIFVSPMQGTSAPSE